MPRNRTFLFALGFLIIGTVTPSRADTASVSESTSTVKKKKKMTLQDLLRATAGSSKHSTTVAGVRGLEDTGGAADTKARNFVAVEKLEKVTISDDELAKFVAEGRLK